MKLKITQQEYYVYNERGISAQHSNVLVLKLQLIRFHLSIWSYRSKQNMVLSYLHKAIKPVNQLRMIEDAVVIYRIVRAPERRIFYIDVGNLPKVKAEHI
jgi:hypothetical protein